ncbi:tyrosinase precursor [Sporothrix brasiliensis 5110]|uniref:Tyrosinase n=1 Tax=Sporothrix brasiliensis 5110 TaxID=1398154 RepID=A0A0C2IMK2_9PEZI|nr:tyrosinase precursor [Sporothrix brasiliensis 5110]KIH90271.1 tyrosinase precursor [Sporothrix brasiliensis 5110]
MRLPSISISSFGRPLLAVALSSWLLSELLPAATAQSSATPPGIVVGVSNGINNSTGQRPSRININDLYNEAGPHWDLYVQALDMFQRDDMTEIESYYQIAGIHGLPFLPWNGVNQTTGGANSGYCPHGQTTFISWHRPYLALFEQILARHVLKAAKQYPVETVDAYTAAAQTFRIPYWDWAQDASLPPAVVGPTVNFNGPAGPATMRNPLVSFQFPNFPFHGGGFGGSLAQFNETKRCTTVSGAAAGVSDEDQANSVMGIDGGQLQDKVYAVFTHSTTFEAMATMSNAGASFEEPHNVVHNDIACFSVAGHSGHMGDLNWSGFDPIFMLHHANVDRLYAMWQAINFNDPVFTTSQHGNALYGTPSGPVTANSPLKPFMGPSVAGDSSSPLVFYTSRSVEAMAVFGYTYPEIDDWSLAPADLANSVRSSVNNLYGPGASGVAASRKSKREAASASRLGWWKLPHIRRVRAATNDNKGSTIDPTAAVTTAAAAALHPATVIPNARALSTNDYSIEVSVDRAQLPLPCTIELHLNGQGGGKTKAGHHRDTTRIGSTSILSMPQTGTSYSVTPVRRTLVHEATRRTPPAVFNNNDDVLARLRGISVVIKTPEGRAVLVSSVPSLNIIVQQRSYTPMSADNLFPKYGPVTSYSVKPLDLEV